MEIKSDTEKLLRDFVYWMRKRRALYADARDAWVSEETLECVAQGVERFLEGGKPWPRSQRRGRRSETYTMWLCYQMAYVVPSVGGEYLPFLPQHKGSEAGAYCIVGERLNLSPDAVESRVRNARKQLKTTQGEREYHVWLNQRELMWWVYQAKCVEKRELKLLVYDGERNADTLFLEPEEVESLVNVAVGCLEGKSGQEDYREWLNGYDRRADKRKPLHYLPHRSE